MPAQEQKHLAQARSAWERGDVAFILNVQGETIWFKEATNRANAQLINDIVKVGWTLQGTAEKTAGRRMLTFSRERASTQASVDGLFAKIERLPEHKRRAVERLVDEMLDEE